MLFASSFSGSVLSLGEGGLLGFYVNRIIMCILMLIGGKQEAKHHTLAAKLPTVSNADTCG